MQTLEYRKRICQAMDFISHNLDRDLSLEEIADSASFSRFHFHRIFKAVVGETVAGFTRRLRLEWAANRLLACPLRDITAVAMDCGFSSSQNFAKAFKRHFDTTPSAFRQSRTCPASRPFPGLRKPSSSPGTMGIMALPPFRVAYVRRLGAYDNHTHDAAFTELLRWSRPRGYPGRFFGVYWDNPDVTPPGKCRIDACISIPDPTIPEAPVSTYTLHGGTYAVARVDVSDDNFQEPWERLFEWIVDNGYAFEDFPNYQIYRNNGYDHPRGIWRVEMCVPLKTAS